MISLSIPRAASVRVRIAVARLPCPPSALSSGEAAELGRLAFAARRETWLRGRAALKRLLPGLGLDTDTSGLKLPHPQVSLTHSGGIAVAVGTRSIRLAGIGVDYETRPPSPEAARRFLTPDERRKATSPPELLRLWTIKEACFKADPLNTASELPDYAVRGRAAWKGAWRFVLRVRRFAGGYLSIALLPKVEPWTLEK